jgi:hypothetical protein
MRLWDVHWAIHPVSPSVLLDNLDIHEAEYGIWRPEYKDHAYKNLKFSKVPDGTYYAFVTGNRPPNAEADFPKPLQPVDDLPPVTVVTQIEERGGKYLVRGTTSDNGTVKRVLVNGKEAKSVAANFAQWEIELSELPDKRTVTAHAEDEAGNVERTPHVVSVGARER